MIAGRRLTAWNLIGLAVVCLWTLTMQSASAQAVITSQIRFSQGAGGVGTGESISFYVDVVNASTGQPVPGASITASLKNAAGASVWTQTGTTTTDGTKFFVISPTARQNSTGQHTLTADVQVAGGGQSTATVNVTIGTGVTATPPPAAAPAPAQTPGIIFEPEVPLPQFVGGAISADTFAQYLRAVFITFIWSVGGLAVVMIIFGGVRWVAAAGEPARINQAREIINNALIGLIIALVSVVLLNLISGRLTNFQGLTLKSAKSEPLVFDNVPGINGEGSTGACTTKGKTITQESTCFVPGEAFVWPVDPSVAKLITSRVGPRQVQGAANASTCHSGTDFSTNRLTGKYIRAAHAGLVEIPPNKVANEYAVFVRADTYFTRYIHISQLIAVAGQRVPAGALLGTSGGDPKVAAGWSSAPHLHVELYAANGELHDLAPCVQ